MTDLSRYFTESEMARTSTEADLARLRGAAFSLFAVFSDAIRLPQFISWLDQIARKTNPREPV